MAGKDGSWSFVYRIGPEPIDRMAFFTHAFNAYGMNTRGKRPPVRSYRRQTVVEKGRWVHYAMTWGPNHEGRTAIRIFVDGRLGDCVQHMRAREAPESPIESFALSGRFPTAYDELRISTIRRYATGFDAPSRYARFVPDGHTAALFHFDGDLTGRGEGEIEGVIGR
jgi:hypothetical protein